MTVVRCPECSEFVEADHLDFMLHCPKCHHQFFYVSSKAQEQKAASQENWLEKSSVPKPVRWIKWLIALLGIPFFWGCILMITQDGNSYLEMTSHRLGFQLFAACFVAIPGLTFIEYFLRYRAEPTTDDKFKFVGALLVLFSSIPICINVFSLPPVKIKDDSSMKFDKASNAERNFIDTMNKLKNLDNKLYGP